jgi:DNA replication and repair protein RecF
LNTIKKITLLQFRNYSSAAFGFDRPVTCIAGPNGSGKTNLLDAVYYLCYTKSYFSSYQHYSVQKGADGFRIEGEFEGADGADIIACKWKQGKKEIYANGVEYEKVTDHIGKYAAVMIAPDDMELINGGGELRRKWIDSILGQTDREYLENIMQYQHILLQRNAWLRMQANTAAAAGAELEFYNSRLAASGAYIYERRSRFLGSFLPLLADFYERLSGGKETIEAVYTSDLQQKPLQDWLEQTLQHDLRLQRTLRGIHKDDWNFMLDSIPIKQFGSQGQKKSFLFALKLAQYEYVRRFAGHAPILLLDDIFEKLDQNRIEALMRIIRGAGFGQVILTDTHPQRIEQAFDTGEQIGFIYLD